MRVIEVVLNDLTGRSTVKFVGSHGPEEAVVEPADIDNFPDGTAFVRTPEGEVVVLDPKQVTVICKCCCAHWRAQEQMGLAPGASSDLQQLVLVLKFALKHLLENGGGYSSSSLQDVHRRVAQELGWAPKEDEWHLAWDMVGPGLAKGKPS